MRIFSGRRAAAVAAIAVASTGLGGAAHALLDNLSLNVSDLIGDVSVEALTDLISLDNVLNDLHLLSCDSTNIISNESEANEQGNEQSNRCAINVLNVGNLLNGLSLEGVLEDGLNVLTEGS